PRVASNQGQECLTNAWTQPLANDDRVHVTSVEIPCGGLDAQRPDESGAFTDRGRKNGVRAAARDAEHRGLFQQVRRHECEYFVWARCTRAPQRGCAIGKAPALPSTSARSAAELSATISIGPSNAMTRSRCAGWITHPKRGLLTAR